MTTFLFFMNTRANKCLAYGPGLLEDQAINTPTTFVIQARNENCQNRQSGRDNFTVKITTVEEESKEVPCEVEDKDDGSYHVTYQVDHECPVKVDILFEDDKGKNVHIRGSPYKASFSEKT